MLLVMLVMVKEPYFCKTLHLVRGGGGGVAEDQEEEEEEEEEA